MMRLELPRAVSLLPILRVLLVSGTVALAPVVPADEHIRAQTVTAAHRRELSPHRTPRSNPEMNRNPSGPASSALDPVRVHNDEQRLTAILASYPDDAGALAGMGWVRSRQRNFPAAISYFEAAKRQRPNDTKLLYALDEARFQLMMQEARECLKTRDLVNAENRYRAALQIRPHSAEAMDGLRTTRVLAAH